MSFHNDNDIKLDMKINEIKECMVDALELIDTCNNDPLSEFNTTHLKKDINRFLEDY